MRRRLSPSPPPPLRTGTPMTTALPRTRAGIPFRRSSLALCLAAVLAMPPAIASTITVSNCDDSVAGSLRAAVASAISGDTIDFSATLGCSTISLTSGAITIGQGGDGQPIVNLEIEGPGRNALTIDGGYTDRVLVHAAGATGALTIAGIKLQHGFTDGDGGCLESDGSVNLSDVEISECGAAIGATGGARHGGGVSVAGDATLTSSFIGDNTVDGTTGYAYGGGLFAGSTATLIATTVSGNFATSDNGGTFGGGVAVGDRANHLQGTLTVSSSSIQNNAASSHCGYCGVRGGGAFVYGNSTFEDSTISGNSAFSDAHYGAGGGLYFSARYGAAPVTATLTGTDLGSNSADEDGGAIGANGNLSFTRGTISGNSARNGGAILLLGGNADLVDSLLTGNIAMDRGGGIFIHGYGDAAAENTTISENLAQGSGGAIANTYGSVHLSNSTLSANSANGQGGGIWF